MSVRERAERLRGALPPERVAAPPVERGKRLATIPRSPTEELRVCWDAFEGRPYLSIRVWTRSADGGWWPDSKRGMSVRLRELPAFADVVGDAVDLAAEHATIAPRTDAGACEPENGRGERSDNRHDGDRWGNRGR